MIGIYTARELPMRGVTPELILNEINCNDKALCNKKDLINTIKNYNFDVLLTVGAGDINNYLSEICDILSAK